MPPTSYSKPSFPEDWNAPMMPGYGTFPWPFSNATHSYQDIARSSQEAIETALVENFRHIDTAFTYRNQDLIGRAIRTVGISRDEIHVTSKLHQNNNFYKDAKKKIIEAIKLVWGSDASSDIAYLDAFLLHYPGAGRPLDAWKALQDAAKDGYVKYIGVSNFEIRHLRKLKDGSGEYPQINQIEFHPCIYNEQAELLQFCRDKGIALEGYSPLAQGLILQKPEVIRIAAVHRTTPARIVLKWCMQHGVRPIVGSRNPDHLRINTEPYNFILSIDEMQALNVLGDVQTIRVAEKWKWNPKTAAFGGPIPDHSWRFKFQRWGDTIRNFLNFKN